MTNFLVKTYDGRQLVVGADYYKHTVNGFSFYAREENEEGNPAEVKEVAFVLYSPGVLAVVQDENEICDCYPEDCEYEEDPQPEVEYRTNKSESGYWGFSDGEKFYPFGSKEQAKDGLSIFLSEDSKWEGSPIEWWSPAEETE
jgi:hypothetical protein